MAENVGIVRPVQLEDWLKEGKEISVIDVREDEEVAAGKIPQAIHIPLGDIPARSEELDPSREYVLVCRSGHRSELAAEFLQEKGFRVKNMAGGMLAWQGSIN